MVVACRRAGLLTTLGSLQRFTQASAQGRYPFDGLSGHLAQYPISSRATIAPEPCLRRRRAAVRVRSTYPLLDQLVSFARHAYHTAAAMRDVSPPTLLATVASRRCLVCAKPH